MHPFERMPQRHDPLVDADVQTMLELYEESSVSGGNDLERLAHDGSARSSF
jgi:hypothetical protein